MEENDFIWWNSLDTILWKKYNSYAKKNWLISLGLGNSMHISTTAMGFFFRDDFSSIHSFFIRQRKTS